MECSAGAYRPGESGGEKNPQKSDSQTEFELFDACCGFHSAMAKVCPKFVELGLGKDYLDIPKEM